MSKQISLAKAIVGPPEERLLSLRTPLPEVEEEDSEGPGSRSVLEVGSLTDDYPCVSLCARCGLNCEKVGGTLKVEWVCPYFSRLV